MGYFLDDSGNFQNLDFFGTNYWSFLGPWTLYFWLFLHQITSKNIRKYMGTSWKNIIFPCLTNKIFENFRKANPPFFWIYFLDIYFVYILYIFFEYMSSKYFCGDEDWKMINFPLIKSTKAWIWILFVSKNMNRILP